jgi:hypothetical protein
MAQRSLRAFDKLAQSLAKRNGQLVGNLDSNTDLPEFNRANVGAVNSSPLSEVLLGQADLFAGTPHAAAKSPARESSCLWHTLFV